MRKIHWIIISLLLVWHVTAQTGSAVPRLSPKVKEVAGVSNPAISLNGEWTFHTASVPETPISVPGEWTMQGFTVPEGETAFYTRTFDLPADWQDKRIKIRFDAVSSYGKVFVNNQEIGEHEGGMVPFEFDITNTVKPGLNTIRVEVQAWTISDRLGCISQYACHPVGGLLRKVTLFALPPVNIAGMDVVTLPDKSFKNAQLQIYTNLAWEATPAGSAKLEYTLKDKKGKVVTATQKAVDKDCKLSTAILSVQKAEFWNPEEPYLYTLTTSLYVDNKIVQTNEQPVGIRHIEVKGNLLYVNGKVVKLRGVNRHEVHPLYGRSLTPELCRQDAELFKAGNCNYIRTSHYPPSEEFLEACDEIGLFVESEAALNWIQHGSSPIWKKWDYEDEQYLPYLVRANVENVLAGRRHPSVIIWSIANESRWSPLWEKVNQVVKELDPSRPTSFHDQCWGGFNNANSKADIANYHYPNINGPAACDTMSRPTLFGEYAHLTCYNSRELLTDPGVRAGYGPHLAEMYDSIYYHPACLGGAIWSGIDDIFHLPDGRITGYGPWGPIDGWRREKPEYTGMKKAYTPFRILAAERNTKQLVLTVENRYNFLNFNRLTIEAGSKEGKMIPVKSNLAAGSRGTIQIPLSGQEHKDIYLKVTDPQGRVFHEELFILPETMAEEKQKIEWEAEDKENALHLSRTDSTNKQTVIFSKITGVITQVRNNQSVIMNQGPVFCLVPMNSDNGGKPNIAAESYQNNIYPLKSYPNITIFINNLRYRKDDTGDIILEMETVYRNGDSADLTYTFSTNNTITVAYSLKIAAEESRPRQYGMLMQLPKTFDCLEWERNGEFSVYPEYDIARIKGKAQLNANDLYEVEKWGMKPVASWKEDANVMGSVDFRSTKTNIRKAILTDQQGRGIILHGNETQAIRSWLQDEQIQVLMADYNNAGSEPFYGTPFTKDRITVKKGDILTGELTFELK